MKLFLPFLLFFSVMITQAQQDTLHIHTFGNNFENKGADIIETQNGNFLAVGSTFNEVNQSSDVYVLKLNENYEKIWSFSYGTNFVEVANSVVQMNNGNFLITGYSNKIQGNGYDVYALCLDLNGGFVWENFYGGIAWDFGYDLVKRFDNTYYICGETKSFGAGEKDAYLLHINENGTLLTENTYGSSLDDVFYGITQSNDGSMYVVGETNSIADSTNLYMVKLDQTGSLVFENNYGSVKYDVGVAVDEAIDGDIVVMGTSNSHSNRADVDIVYYRFSSLGDSLLSRVFAVNNDPGAENKKDEGTAIKVLSNGKIVTAGYTQTFGFNIEKIVFDLLPNVGSPESTTFPDIDYRLFNIIQTSDEVVMIGSTKVLGSGNSDLMILHADSLTVPMVNKLYVNADTAVVSVSDLVSKKLRVEVFPNPMIRSFRLKSGRVPERVEVISVNGIRVEVKTNDMEFFELPYTLPKGAYVLQVYYKDGSIVGKQILVTD